MTFQAVAHRFPRASSRASGPDTQTEGNDFQSTTCTTTTETRDLLGIVSFFPGRNYRTLL